MRGGKRTSSVTVKVGATPTGFDLCQISPMKRWGHRAAHGGTVRANSEREAVTILDRQACSPQDRDGQGCSAVAKGGGRVGSRHMVDLLLAAGRPAARRRAAVALPGDPRTAKRQPTLQRDPARGPRQGRRRHHARRRHGRSIRKAFNELSVSMVRAGQEGGFLEDVLERIANFTEHQEDLKAKVIGASPTPSSWRSTAFIVLMVLVVFFVPMFEPIFKRLERKGRAAAVDRSALIGVQPTHHQLLVVDPRSLSAAIVFGCWQLTSSERPRCGSTGCACGCRWSAMST